MFDAIIYVVFYVAAAALKHLDRSEIGNKERDGERRQCKRGDDRGACRDSRGGLRKRD